MLCLVDIIIIIIIIIIICIEINLMWNEKCMIIPVINGVNGLVTESLK
jgi:hypothetical protein